MEQAGVRAVALAAPESIYYLTGLDHLGYFALTVLVVPAEGDLVLVTREMERPTVRAQVPHCAHRPFGDGTDPAVIVADVLAEAAPGNALVATEAGSLFFPPAVHDRVRAALPGRGWAEATPLLGPAMAVKSADEIDLVRRAAAVSDAAMAAGVARAGTGVGEHELAAAIHQAMFALGGQQPGFSPLIRPLWMIDQEHVSWGERVLAPGSGLFLELSGCVRRYHAPLSRTVYVGRLPDGAVRAHSAAVAGLDAALDALRPGARTGDVYETWQAAAGVLALRHHCGYLVGIGFPPSWVGGGEVLGIRPGGDTVLEPGMTFHLMSWVPGHVVSDTALVTPTGAELLTTCPRDLTVVN